MAMKMTMVSMEMPSGGNSLSRRRAGTETSVPRTWLRDGGGCVTFLVPWLMFLGFSRRRDFIGGRAALEEPGGGPPIGRRAPLLGRASLWCGGPGPPLRLPFGVLVRLGEI